MEREGRGLFSFLKHLYSLLILNYSSLIHYLSLLTVITILLVLPVTMIRAAWIAAISGTLVVAWPWLKAHMVLPAWLFALRSGIKYKVLAVILTLAIVCGVGIWLYHIKKGSSVGKLFIWEVTLGKIAEKPLFGYGVSRFEAEYNNWQAEYFKKHPSEMDSPKGMAAGNTKYAFNEFLEMTAETGIVGLILFVGLIAMIMMKMTTMKKWIVYSSFSSFILSLMVSFPFYSLPTLIVFFITLSSISVYTTNYSIYITLSMKLLNFVVVVMFLGGVFIVMSAKNLYRGYYYWDEADKLYNTGSYADACMSFQKAEKSIQLNGLLLQYYGIALTMKLDYQTGIIQLGKSSHYAAEEVLLTTLGDSYKATKQYNKAEKAYITAFYMRPDRYYPLYLLTKLYNESAQPYKRNAATLLLLNKKTKVPSQAIDEMRLEIKKFTNYDRCLYESINKSRNTSK